MERYAALLGGLTADDQLLGEDAQFHVVEYICEHMRAENGRRLSGVLRVGLFCQNDPIRADVRLGSQHVLLEQFDSFLH